MDLVPEPTIVAAALRACRRVNDYALTTRFAPKHFKNQHFKSFVLQDPGDHQAEMRCEGG